ncbi:hypothetical protein BWI17_09350 [Betaproteobacteria bacterium GR16-43]|nr:hypothetical protein BWI17_09350 [Betaproteobacteria bacterium GR16-43]
MNAVVRFACAAVLMLGLAGCYVAPYPYPYPAPAPADPMDQPWAAATGALQDVGLTVVTADRATGTLRGTRGNVEGIIEVRVRPDGRVGVEMKARDPDNRDPKLTDRMAEAYNRRMGR